MSAILFDFSERPELTGLAEVVAAVQAAARDLEILLVGATARDLLLRDAYGIDTGRVSLDVDLAIAVPDWPAFQDLRRRLLASETFSEGPVAHIVFFRKRRVDLIPFGAVERSDRTIAWPPDGGQVMNVLGFAEALRSADVVRLPGATTISVVSLPAFAVLKLVAWRERRYDARGKDAADLFVVLNNYAAAGNEDLIYDHCVTVLEAVQLDQDRAGAWLLGAQARRVLELGSDRERAISVVRLIIAPEIDPDGPLRLVTDMPPGDKTRQLALLTDFHDGFVAESDR